MSNLSEPNSITEILAMEPMEFTNWLRLKYVRTLPTPTNIQEFKQHAHILTDLSNAFSFLSALHAMAAIQVRESKRRGLDKDVIDACTSRRDAVDDILKGLKLQYEAFSRLITVHQQANEELKMLREV